ncbi:MAG: hypothetical protein GY703_22085 [Gammaproteobacteria bacterium]|nr:hypothetical protein [Gammaproteobacteria bacterium]
MPSLNQQFAVSVDPGELHFNAAHFITFDQTCENLHGHNFHVRITATGGNNRDAFVVDFVLLNRLAAQICAGLTNRILLPGESSEVVLQVNGNQIDVSSYDKRFSLPTENCVVLPLPNTTAEMLAWFIMESLIPLLTEHDCLSQVGQMEVAVEEADRQWGICRRSFHESSVP